MLYEGIRTGGGVGMKGKALAGLVRVGLVACALAGTIVVLLYAAPATYCGITFPHGDSAFADRVVEYVAASCVRDAYDDPEEALGPPDACPGGGCEGCDGCSTNAVALGYRLSVIDNRGYLVLEFVDNVLVDVPGNDLFIYNTNDHPCRVEISADGFDFTFVGEIVGYPGGIDISPFADTGDEFRFVRLSDVPSDEDHSWCPGPSIDAVGAMGYGLETIFGEAFGSLELQPVGELAVVIHQAPDSILIILDASSSMGETIDGDVKIEVAKDVIIDLIGDLAEGSLVGMRIFSGCGNTPLISAISPLDRTWLQNEVRKIQPRGATPIAEALELARQDFAGIPDTKLILLVSDGMETCQGDPVAAARDLIAEGYDLRIHVVGFDVGAFNRAREQLIAIAQSTGGVYFDAASSEELRRAISLTAPFSYAVYDEVGQAVYDGRLGDDGPELAAGVYRVVIDTTPPIVLENVTITGQRTTMITVAVADGGYHAEVEP
jgi:hypothetical protein